MAIPIGAYGVPGFADAASMYWQSAPWWGGPAPTQHHPGAFSVQVVEAHLHQQAMLQQQRESYAREHAANVASWTQFAAATAMPNASTVHTGSMQGAAPLKDTESAAGTLAYDPPKPQEPLDFASARFKLLSARDVVGETKRPNLKLRTATASEIDKKMETAPKANKVQIQTPTLNTAANPPSLPESPAQRAQKNAGASILRMVMEKDAASEYLMQQLKGMPEQLDTKVPKCARGAALLNQLKTPYIKQGPRDTNGAALLNMIQNNASKPGNFGKKRRNRQG